MEILAFLNGILLFYTHDYLICALIIICLYLKSSKKIVIWFVLAMVWAAIHGEISAERGMPRQPLLKQARVTGEIISIPITDDNKTQFEFKIDQLNHHWVDTHAQLSCYQHCPAFKVGERWKLVVKLKKPIDLGNPGAAKIRDKLAAHHIYWVGSMQGRNSRRVRTSQNWLPILQWREQLAEQLKHAIPDPEVSGIIQALTLGIGQQISSAQWQLFRQTGTTHLMVISGAHIGLIGGLFYFFVEWLWRRSARLCLLLPSQQVGGVVAILAAISYALLAGFAIPAQRSVIAAILLMSRFFLNWRIDAWQAWRAGLWFVLLTEPHAVFFPGFYLSFTAVAILMGTSQRLWVEGWRKLIILQIACLLGLMPMSLYWFSYSAINGFFANLLAIPWVGYLLVPMSLLALGVVQISSELPIVLPILNGLTHGLLGFLTWIDHFSWMNCSFALNDVVSMLTLLGVFAFAMILPLSMVWLPLGIILLSCYIPFYQRPAEGEAWVDVLDVGQGLSVLIRTAHYQLLYDTGVAFYKGGDMGMYAILPYLRTQGIQYLDGIVISHPDLDHRGGLATIEKALPVERLWVNDVEFYHHGRNCHTQSDWRWDGVKFHFIALQDPSLHTKNNNSCVLKVTTKAGSVLLPGDIEKEAEYYLLNHQAAELVASVLVVAHHGSKTSSTPGFIHQVSPQYAIISAGFDNRYHFPHEQTLVNLARESVEVFNTMDCGMVTLQLPVQGRVTMPKCFLRSK